MEIKVKKLVDDLHDINQAHNGEWYDLRAAKDVHLGEGELTYIPLGVAISCRRDTRRLLHRAQVLLKSSVSSRQTVSASLTTPIAVTMTNG